jgi:hypothetical protein
VGICVAMAQNRDRWHFFFCEHGSEPVGDVTGGKDVILSGRTLYHEAGFMREFAAVC